MLNHRTIICEGQVHFCPLNLTTVNGSPRLIDARSSLRGRKMVIMEV
jgi:hypothetical protein